MSVSGPVTFSILVNNYNYESYVATAIESALSQTWPHVEVIVVDDGSSDGSREVIRRYAEKIILLEKENGGQASALNEAFEVAQGEIILFLDSDDVLHPEVCSLIASSYSEDVSMYQFRLSVCDEHGRSTGASLPAVPLLQSGHASYLMKFGYVPSPPMSGVAYSHAYLSRIFPFDTGFWSNATDGYMMFVAPLFGKVRALDEKLGSYRVHARSLSQHYGISLKKERQMLGVDAEISRAISRYARELHAKSIDAERLLGPYHWQRRLFSCVVDKAGHPFPEDTRLRLLINAVRAFLLWPDIKFFSVIRNLLFLAFVCFAPGLLSARAVLFHKRYSDVAC